MTLTAKQKIKIYIAVFILVLALLILLGVAPLIKALLQTSRDVANKKDTLALMQGQISALEEFQKNNKVYQASIKKVEASFISQEAPIAFIEFLENEVQKQNLAIIISSVQEGVEKKGPRVTTVFQVALGGSFPQCLAFLKRLEQSPWLIKIDQINIKRVEEQNKPQSFKNLGEGEVVLALSFKTFYNYLASVVR